MQDFNLTIFSLLQFDVEIMDQYWQKLGSLHDCGLGTAKLHIAHCSVHSVQCTVYMTYIHPVHIVYTAQYTLHIAQCTCAVQIRARNFNEVRLREIQYSTNLHYFFSQSFVRIRDLQVFKSFKIYRQIDRQIANIQIVRREDIQLEFGVQEGIKLKQRTRIGRK